MATPVKTSIPSQGRQRPARPGRVTPLIRTRNGTFASIERPWIKPCDHGYWIDSPAVTEHFGALSCGEQRLLRIAASIGSDQATPLRHGNVVSGPDRPTLQLVLAAVADAGGDHRHSRLVIDRDGRATIAKEPSLFIWDGDARPRVDGFVQVVQADAVDLSTAIGQAPVHAPRVGRGVRTSRRFGFMTPAGESGSVSRAQQGLGGYGPGS